MTRDDASTVGGPPSQQSDQQSDQQSARQAARQAAQLSDGSPPRAVVRTTYAGRTPTSREPSLPGLAAVDPRPGTVGRLGGPFDDRFRWRHVSWRAGAVTGEMRIVSDVSDVLELQVLAGFYDREGRLLSTARWTHHGEHGEHGDTHDPAAGPQERFAFRVDVPRRLRGEAVSAAVGVPVLVNE